MAAGGGSSGGARLPGVSIQRVAGFGGLQRREIVAGDQGNQPVLAYRCCRGDLWMLRSAIGTLGSVSKESWSREILGNLSNDTCRVCRCVLAGQGGRTDTAGAAGQAGQTPAGRYFRHLGAGTFV